MREKIDLLLEQKSKGTEQSTTKPIEKVDQFIRNEIVLLSEENLERGELPSIETFDHVFQTVLGFN